MKNKGLMIVLSLALVAGLLGVLPAPRALAAATRVPDAPLTAISLTGGTYSQTFDTLANSGTSSTVPNGWAFSESDTNANSTYTAGTGSSNTGDTYSFGATSSSDRAFGGLRSSNLVPTIGAEFSNGTGATITSLAVGYNCEHWRIGVDNRGAADRIDFQYSTDATSLTTGTWSDANSLDCSSTVTSGAIGALNGNTNRTAVSSSVTNLNIANGATFWLRWTDFDISNADDGLAVDDFNVTPSGAQAITLADFNAAQTGDAVLLTWETNSELENRGFNLYRGVDPSAPDRQLNDALIPSQSQGNPGGFIYTWEDRADLVSGTTYYYWVEDVDIYGAATRHGPVSVDYGAPTAVRLLDAGAVTTLPWAMPLIGAGLLALAGLAATGRRRS